MFTEIPEYSRFSRFVVTLVTLCMACYLLTIQKQAEKQQERIRIDYQTHVPCPDEDGDMFDFWVETVHVLQLLYQLTEVLTLPHVFKHVRLLLASRDLDVETTVVCRTLDQLLDCSNARAYPQFMLRTLL